MRRRYDETASSRSDGIRADARSGALDDGAALDAIPAALDEVHADLLARFGKPDPKLSHDGMSAEQGAIRR